VQTSQLCTQTRAGGLVVGVFAAIAHPASVEVLGGCGFDFICFDAEHSPIDRSGIENLVRAADVTGTPSVVRVPGVDPIWIATAMDCGAAGVVVPRVDTADDAARAASALRYPPHGSRGAGPARASRYGADRGYRARAAADSVLAVQVETVAGLENAEGIAQTEGVDVVFVGPGDLGISLQAAGRGDELEDAIQHVFSVTKAAGKAVGIFCPPQSEVVAARMRAGASWLAVGVDAGYLSSAARTMLAETRALGDATTV
jgi:4-hydroxy-2-oxoheptanedioate aldolase